MCTNCEEVSRKKQKSECSWAKCPSLTNDSKIISFVMTLMLLVVNVHGDDTIALRNTISSLCSLNSVGTFASCCKERDLELLTLNNKTSWDCFVRDMEFDNQNNITSLFGNHNQYQLL